MRSTSYRRRRTVNSFSRCFLFFMLLRRLHIFFLLSNEETPSEWTASKRDGGETFLSLVISSPPKRARPPPKPLPLFTRDVTATSPTRRPSTLGGGAAVAITETVAAADARFFAPISWVVYRIDVFFFFLFSAPTGCDPGEEQPWLPLHSGQSCK